MKFTYILLFVVSQFFPAGALAQTEGDGVDEEGGWSGRVRYALKQCYFDVDFARGAEFLIPAQDDKDSIWNTIWHTIYKYPLGKTDVNDAGFDAGEGGMELFCGTGSSILSSWVNSINNEAWAQEYEPRRIRLTGENWEGVLFVRNSVIHKGKLAKDVEHKSFSFCIHDNEGTQSLCGSGAFYLDNDTELDKLIETIKRITFVPMSVPRIPAPSFNCTKATTETEKAICANPVISDLDAVVVTNYLQLKSAKLGANAAKLVADQRAWLKQRNLCKDENGSCLDKSYMQRIDELCKNYPVASGAQPNCIQSIYREGGDVYN
jgi:uncharacterized protein YecT (DUF1311 family)